MVKKRKNDKGEISDGEWYNWRGPWERQSEWWSTDMRELKRCEFVGTTNNKRKKEEKKEDEMLMLRNWESDVKSAGEGKRRVKGQTIVHEEKVWKWYDKEIGSWTKLVIEGNWLILTIFSRIKNYLLLNNQ